MRYIHLREHEYSEANGYQLCSKGGMTVGYILLGDKVRYSTSRCNDKDHYNKSIGRKIVEGRMVKNQYVEIDRVDHHLVDAIISNIEHGGEYHADYQAEFPF